MNRIHTKLRNRLGIAALREIMCICSLGPSIADYDPKPAMHDWLESKVRSLSKVRREVMGIGGGDDSDNEGDSDGGQ